MCAISTAANAAPAELSWALSCTCSEPFIAVTAACRSVTTTPGKLSTTAVAAAFNRATQAFAAVSFAAAGTLPTQTTDPFLASRAVAAATIVSTFAAKTAGSVGEGAVQSARPKPSTTLSQRSAAPSHVLMHLAPAALLPASPASWT